jgi:hypothetical protein
MMRDWLARHPFLNELYELALSFRDIFETFGLVAAVFLICRAWYLRRGRKDQEHIRLLEERIRNDDARLKERTEKVRLLESALQAAERRLAESALLRHTREKREGNDIPAVVALEEWFEAERYSIGTAAKILAEHYASYGEPELVRDALRKSYAAALVALGCAKNPVELRKLSDEIAILSAEFQETPTTQLERSVDILNDFLGPSLSGEVEQRTAATISTAERRMAEGRYRIAFFLADRAVRIAKRLPIDHRLKHLASSLYGECLLLTGRPAEAEAILRDTFSEQERIDGYDAVSTLSTRLRLAEALISLRKSAEAVETLRNVSSVHVRDRGHEHPRTLAALTYLARAESDIARSAESKKILLRTIPALKKLYGKEHISTLTAYYYLGCVLEDLGQSARAERVARSIIPIQARLAGERHPHHTIATRHLLATALYSLDRFSEAEQTIVEVLEARNRITDVSHPDALASRELLARIWNATGRKSEAETLLRSIAAECAAVLGATAQDTLVCRGLLARVLNEMGGSTEAEEILREVVPAIEQLMGAEHPSALVMKYHLANALNVLGRQSEAREVLQDALPVQRKIRGPRHRETIKSEKLLQNLTASD